MLGLCTEDSWYNAAVTVGPYIAEERPEQFFVCPNKVFITRSWSKTIRLRKLWHHLRNKNPLQYLLCSSLIHSVSQWVHLQILIECCVPDTISDTGESAMNKIHRNLWPRSKAHCLNKHVLKLYSVQEVMLMFRIKKSDILTWDQPVNYLRPLGAPSGPLMNHLKCLRHITKSSDFRVEFT